MPHSTTGLDARDRLRRASRIAATFGRVYLGAKSHQWIARRLRPPDMAQRWSALHRANAAAIYETAIELRGLILKACQFLGARADVVPPEWVEGLAGLQDRVPPRGFGVVRSVVERELGAPLEESFEWFAERPLAAASLAQVHLARLHGGERVAVKVQYPEIAAQVRGDLANLRTLFRAVDWLERDFDVLALVEELGAQIPRELDFVNEGRNAERIGAALAERGDVVVPRILWSHTTERLLVMEFLEGIKISDRAGLVAAGVDPDAVARLLADVFAEQVLGHGHFHADPHPGNLLVQPEGPKLVLLDFGLAKELPPRFREGVIALAASLLAGERSGLAAALAKLGFETRDGDPAALADIADLMLEVREALRSRGHLDPDVVAKLRREIPARVRANPIVRIPHHLVLVGRVIGLVSGVSRSLGARLDLAASLLPHAMPAPPAAAPPRARA